MTTSASAVRRATIGREAVWRRPFRPSPRTRLPRWVRRLLLGTALVLLLLIGLVACAESEKPASLENSTFAGPRKLTGPLCLEEAVDISGSMLPFRAQREEAEAALFRFARRELGNGQDLFSAAFFAGNGKVAVGPTPLPRLTSAPVAPADVDLAGTLLAPAVQALTAARVSAPQQTLCAATALIVITDGIIGDLPQELDDALTKASYTRVFAVIPAATGWSRPAELRGGGRDAIEVFHFMEPGVKGRASSILIDAKPLDVVFGEIIGSLTGQKLVRIEKG